MLAEKRLVIIPSAGMGRRMGSRKKNYLPVLGAPVLAHTLAAFEAAPSVDAVILAVPSDDIAFCKDEIVKKYKAGKVILVVAGGPERQDSVANALEAAKGLGFDIIAVHDGARPLVTVAVIEDTLRGAAENGSAIAAVPVKDTIKEAVGKVVQRTVPRETLWSVQTPQAFRAEIIFRAFELAKKNGFYGTDESSLVERLGEKVAIVMGSYENIKITTEEDMTIAECVLKKRGLAALS